MPAKQNRETVRQNEAKAAGFRTPQRIQTLSMNALRHQLTSQTQVLANACPDKFAEFPKIYIERFQPQDGMEMNLVDEMVAARWRQQFGKIIQTTLIDLLVENREVEVRSEPMKALYRLCEQQNLRNDPKPAPPSRQKSPGNYHQTATSRPAEASKRSPRKRPSGNTAADPDRFRTFTRRDKSIDKIKSAEYAKQESGENFSMHCGAAQSKIGGEGRLC